MHEEQKDLVENAELNLALSSRADKSHTKSAVALLIILAALTVPFILLYFKVVL